MGGCCEKKETIAGLQKPDSVAISSPYLPYKTLAQSKLISGGSSIPMARINSARPTTTNKVKSQRYAL